MREYKEQIGNLTFDLLYQTIEMNGKSVALTPIEFVMLMLLASNANKTFTREQIRTELKGTKATLRNLRTVDVHISRLKKKLKTLGADMIKNAFGAGYFISGLETTLEKK